ncbi:MAG: cyclic nucleotide-binding domain-containing protein [Rhodoferax sp.]|nr:cyclic nucleotide-binding domain-containing protein [Rhodoferax sp.]
MSTFTISYSLWAALLGAICAGSLLLGSVLGMLWTPRHSITAGLTAFGAGALIAALSVALVAPVAMGVTAPHAGQHGGGADSLLWLLAGCIAGGVLFALLNHMLDKGGGYLRKVSTTISHLRHRRKRQLTHMLQQLGQIAFFQAIPPDHMQILIPAIRSVHFAAGDRLFEEGQQGDRMLFVAHGEVRLTVAGQAFKSVTDGEVLGAITLLTHTPYYASAQAISPVKAFELLKVDFDKLRPLVPELAEITTRCAQMRLEDLHRADMHSATQGSGWAAEVMAGLHTHRLPGRHEIKQDAQEHNSAPLAIWLGSVMDGIPESFVVGAGVLAMVTSKSSAESAPALSALIPYTLIAGLFLSNLPEAFSSSIGMREQGWKAHRIVLLWLSLVLASALSSYLGFLIGAEINHTAVVFVEGVAAGAMLTMIAQTMIPEAVHLGGPNIVGLTTLAGFVSSIAFKLLE